MSQTTRHDPSDTARSCPPTVAGQGMPVNDASGHDVAPVADLPLPEEPADYQAFWRQTWQAAQTIELDPLMHEDPKWSRSAKDKGQAVLRVSFQSWEQRRIDAFVVLPLGQDVKEAWVVGHGYSGRYEPDECWYAPGRALVFPCCRGLGLSAGDDIPGPDKGHSIHGIGSRETYVQRGCVVDTWLAATLLLNLVPAAASGLYYVGSSFGGGIGAMALAWDHRYQRAAWRLPSYGHHPLRLRTPCTGSGEWVRRAYEADAQVARTLSYYDAAVAARRCWLPVLVAVAQSDPAVPPAGQQAVYQALPGVKKHLPLSAGHQRHPLEARENQLWHDTVESWFCSTAQGD